jgi:septum formation protein
MADNLKAQPPAGAARPEAEGLRDRLDFERRVAAQILGAARISIVLASASPRRRDLLGTILPTFDVIPADILEVPRPRETARRFASRAAREKAAHVAADHRARSVLGADTVVTVDGDILGKPRDRTDAVRMLESLSGRTHRVITAIALTTFSGDTDELAVESEVRFRSLSADELGAYVDTGEPFDKAGAYAVQGGGGRFVKAVVGSYSNVIGLPLVEVARLLAGRCEPGRIDG